MLGPSWFVEPESLLLPSFLPLLARFSTAVKVATKRKLMMHPKNCKDASSATMLSWEAQARLLCEAQRSLSPNVTWEAQAVHSQAGRWASYLLAGSIYAAGTKTHKKHQIMSRKMFLWEGGGERSLFQDISFTENCVLMRGSKMRIFVTRHCFGHCCALWEKRKKNSGV